jgi:hypothetical protein
VTQGGLIDEKLRAQQSRETVPLTDFCTVLLLGKLGLFNDDEYCAVIADGHLVVLRDH